VTGIRDLTDWHIEGELWCPDCGSYVEFDGSLAELREFVDETHECGDLAEVTS
jgi:hypothetical protein